MFCRNCGQQVADQAVVCVGCGCPPLAVTRFCQNCGNATEPADQICRNCGCALVIRGAAGAMGGKSKIVAGILGILVGGFGVHRFYLGFVGIGILQIVVTLVTCGVGAIWGLIEGILILTGSMNTDANGQPLTD